MALCPKIDFSKAFQGVSPDRMRNGYSLLFTHRAEQLQVYVYFASDNMNRAAICQKCYKKLPS